NLFLKEYNMKKLLFLLASTTSGFYLYAMHEQDSFQSALDLIQSDETIIAEVLGYHLREACYCADEAQWHFARCKEYLAQLEIFKKNKSTPNDSFGNLSLMGSDFLEIEQIKGGNPLKEEKKENSSEIKKEIVKPVKTSAPVC